jgi:hypothetical protein
MSVEIIPTIVSPLGSVCARSLEAIRNLPVGNDTEMKRTGKRRSTGAIMGSMEIWRSSAREMPDTEDTRARRMTTQEMMIANDKQVDEQTEGDQEDQEDQEGDKRIQQTKEAKLRESSI